MVGDTAFLAYGENMGVMGSLFPQPKITEDADAAADGQKFRLGPIDLESGVVQLQPVRPAEPATDEPDAENRPR